MKANVKSQRILFEELCRKILLINGWSVDFFGAGAGNGIDLEGIDLKTKETLAIEIKHSRNNTYPTSQLTIAVKQLIAMANEASADRAILIVANDIKLDIKRNIEKNYDVEIVDLNKLLSLASKDLDLLSQLARACEIDISTRNFEQQPIADEELPVSDNSWVSSELDIVDEVPLLISRLRAIPLGHEGWRDFEETATEALRHLFDDDLTGWHRQKRTDDELHRFDLICRVLEKSTIWRFISINLDSRYVLFEFKNYSEKIGQDEVYSTEKYLYEKAKRKVCFLVSRKGPSSNAFSACQGAMREHGKLILNIDEDMLVGLLNSKANGDDPNDLIFEQVDKFLMELPR